MCKGCLRPHQAPWRLLSRISWIFSLGTCTLTSARYLSLGLVRLLGHADLPVFRR